MISVTLGFVATAFFASWWNFMVLKEVVPGQIFYNRGYPVPFIGIPKGSIYTINFLIDWLVFSTAVYLVLSFSGTMKLRKKTAKVGYRPGWRVVGAYKDRIEAEVVASLLRANKIEHQILADDVGGTYPAPFAPKSGVELRVARKDFNKAKKLLGSN